ncbi:STAS domain-containing protein [Gemmata sp.]|uniref:STAS domain-containing protein n=1 Tax=Gemmata sp. TaxID=1914242 RepID=UPI003F6E91C4
MTIHHEAHLLEQGRGAEGRVPDLPPLADRLAWDAPPKSAPDGGAAPRYGIAVLACPGPAFTGERATAFGRHAARLALTKAQVVLDVSEVTSIDVTGLLAITSLARVCRERGVALRLCGPTQPVRVLLAAAGVHRLADIFHTRRHAGVA